MKLSKNIILLDGGIGQEIYKRAHSPDSHTLWSLKIMIDNPDLVIKVHQDFIASGARVLSLNNYAATPSRLKKIGMYSSFGEMHQVAIKLLKLAIDKSPVSRADIKVAGSLPPLVASYTSHDERPHKDLYDEYISLIDQQINDVDLFLAETLSSTKEILAVTDALQFYTLKKYISLTLDDNSPLKLRSGELLIDAVKLLKDRCTDVILINCSRPETVSIALPILKNSGIVFGAYANGFSSVEKLEPGKNVNVLESRKDLDPAEYSKFAIDWAENGATFLGGCCEITPNHIQYLSKELVENGYTISNYDL